ncbi:MAG: transglutaminase domain-containing protein [Burkholderiales bacterium]|nr:transglutaminase domain-containing protein [Bacteroidia bacterium]
MAPIVFSTVSSLKRTYSHKELFNIELSRFNSIVDITAHIDGIYSATHTSSQIDTLAYVKATSDIVKKRFYHGLSEYTLKDNWITYIGGHFFWKHLIAIVDPDDILDYTEGLCSQQTIVFLEILKRKGITTRWVGLGYKEGPGHFLAEIYYQGKWHMYDVDMEPKWKKITHDHESVAYYRQHPDSLFLAYEGILSRLQYDKFMEKVKYGNANEFPAKNMLLFHRATKIITYLIPIFLGILILFALFKQKVPNKIIQKAASKLKFK